MLSITPLKNASTASKYYLEEEKDHNLPDLSLEKSSESDNYYLKEKSATPNTQWLGEIAKQAGMEGQEVKQAELEKALSGEWQGEVIHGKRDKHRSGFDLTFSAPKSISLLALVGGDHRLLEAHNNAVKFALSELEKDVAQFKSTGEDGKTEFENSGQMLFAAVLHKTSRADDSQLHTHALAANMTRDDEGRLRALASCLKQKDGVINGTAERIYHNQKYYTALYQSQLGKDAHDLGYSLRGIGNGQFEVAEVPEKVIEQFSKRAEQIQEKTNALGFDSPATRDFAAKNTREAKSYLSEDTLHQRWQNEMEGTGFDIHSVVAKAQSGDLSPKYEPDHDEMKLVTQKTLERTLSHLSQSQTAFTLETLIEQAVSKFSIGGPGDALALKKAAEDKIAEGAWIPLDDKGQLFTTQDMIDMEKRLLGVTKGRVQNMRIPINDKALANLNLSRGNAEKINEVFNSTKQFQVVNVFGSAERVATHLLHVGSQSSRRIHIVSPTAVDKKQSDNQVTQKSHSIAEWIKNQFNPDHRHHLMGFLKADLPLTNKDVLLIDSAQKLSAPEITALSEKAKSSQSKIIFLNRTSSRQGFKSHSAMALFSKGNVASTQWVNDKTTTAQVQLHQQDARSLAQQYANLEDRSQTQVLATTKKEVEQLTSAIRDELKDQGKIARAGVRIETQNPVYLTKAQSEVVTHYKTGMTLKSWNEKTPKEWLISGLSRSKNTLDLMDKETGEISTLQVDKKPFKSLKAQAFKSDSLELVPGDKLLATQKHRASGLKSQETYQLASINEGQLTFTTQKGESMTVEKSQLKDAPLQYGYVSTTNQLSQEHSHLMVSGKSYGFSKNLLQELTQSAQQVDIYSDNLDKTEEAMKKHEYRPSAITRVLDANPVNDRFASALTEQELRRDLSQVLGDKFEGREGSDPIGKAVSFAISHISEREAGFTQKELVMEAIRYAFEEAGQSVTKDEVTQLLAQKSDVLSAEFQDGTRWTTKEAIDTEHRIINGIKAGQGQTKPYASMAETQAFLNNQSRFTQGQKDSVSLIATSKDRFIGVQGLAGTGKSTMLETGVNLVTQALSAGTQQPSKVVGLAPTHAAVSELKEKGIEAQTLESFLTDIRRGATSLEEQKDALFLLDESSMVSNRQAQEFVDIISKADAKAVLLGDKEQLQALSAGKPFELAITLGAMKTAYMTDIVRQQNEHLLGAVHNIIDKQPKSSLDKLAKQPTQTEGTHTEQHVISTLDETRKDVAKAKEEATLLLPEKVAEDYLARTPQTRDNTLIIAYTNLERDDIAEHIRDGMREEGSLGKENINTLRMRQVSATKTELATMMPYKPGLVLSTKPGQYATIESVDKAHGIVTIKDELTEKTSSFFPRHRDHKFTNLFSLSHKPLSTGDRILTRFTDKERGIVANETFEVKSAQSDGIVAATKDGKLLNLNPGQMKDGLWDYAYTRTADMAQGATYRNVIASVRGKGMLTDIRRAGIDQTRASQHMRLYTDNPKAMLKSWINKDTNKASAIETVAQPERTNSHYFNDKPLPLENPLYLNINGDFDRDKFKTYIMESLPKYTESLAVHYLGPANKSQSNKDTMVFGQGKETVTINLTGEYRGFFKDNVTGEKGALINLIMSREDINFSEALRKADNMIQEPEKYNISENPEHERLTKTLSANTAKLVGWAQKYWDTSVPLEGTLAENYLRKRGVEVENKDNVRYHSGVYSSEDRMVHPAILTHIHDRDNNTHAIEIKYLNDAGERADLDISERTLGNKSGNYTNFHKGEDRNTTIITDSMDNAYRIQSLSNSNNDIMIAPDVNVIKKMPDDEIRSQVIIALNHSDSLKPYQVDSIVKSLKDREVRIVDIQDLQKEIQSLSGRIHEAEFNKPNNSFKPIEFETGTKAPINNIERFESLNYNPDISRGQKSIEPDLEKGMER